MPLLIHNVHGNLNGYFGQMGGFGGRPETAETGLLHLSLACWIMKSYGLVGFKVVAEVFRAESDPKMQFECTARNVMHYCG